MKTVMWTLPGVALITASVWLKAEPASSPPLPKNAVIMFVAAWCAPCIRELADFRDLAARAQPQRLLALPVDRKSEQLGLLSQVRADERITLSPREAMALLQRMPGGQNGALPMSVMTDHTGTPCAVSKKPLSAAQLARMRQECAKARAGPAG